MFTYTYEPRYGDYKNFDVLKPATILDFVQDISIRDSDRCGYSLDELIQKNLAWLMQGINIKYLKPLKTHKILEVSTAINTLKGATSQRGCYIKQDGEIVAKTVANWFLFNTEQNRIAKIPEEMQDKYTFHNFDDDFFNYKKCTVLDSVSPQYNVIVSNKELDTNMHLNNQKSAELLMDALPFDFDFTDAEIIYKKPAFLGDKLEVCISDIENGYYVHLQTAKKDVCVAGKFIRI